MSEYMLVNKQSLLDIANELRTVAGLGDTKLAFPEDFISTIQSLSGTTPEPMPTTESLILSFKTGNDVTDKNNNPYTGYVAVGHSTSKIKNDAVWSFTPSISATKAVVTLSWNNNIGSVGWSGQYNYKFELTLDGTEGQNLTSNAKIVSLSGATGSVTIEFETIQLQPGLTYYIRANYENYTDKQTLKAFNKTGTIALTT